MVYAFSFAALWLFLLFFVFDVYSVCPICFDAAHGCGGSKANCPWAQSIDANAAAIVGGVGAVLTVAKVLPAKVTRMLSRPILDAVSALSSRISPGQAYDTNGKSPSDLAKAVKLGHFRKEEALEFIADEIDKLNPDDKHAEFALKKLQNAQRQIEAIHTPT